MAQLVKRSPIQHQNRDWQGLIAENFGWQVVQQVGPIEEEIAAARNAAAICDQTHRGKLRIEGQEAGDKLSAANLTINSGKVVENGFLYRLRSDLFFLSVNAERETAAEKQLLAMQQASASLITISNVTHGNGEIWLLGPKSQKLLGRLCGLDFHNDLFPNHTAKQSSVAKTRQIIIRRDIKDIPVYALIGDRSLANYLWQIIMVAGEDLGVRHIGQRALDELVAG